MTGGYTVSRVYQHFLFNLILRLSYVLMYVCKYVYVLYEIACSALGDKATATSSTYRLFVCHDHFNLR